MKFSPRVLFIGSLEQEGCSGGQRLWALQENQLEVVVLDKGRFQKRASRVRGHLAKMLRDPLMSVFSTDLGDEFLRCCREYQPDLVWMEWPREFTLATLQTAKKMLPNAFFISMQDDNPWGERTGDRWMWKKYFQVAAEFDLHLIKRPEDAIHLGHLGAMKCQLWEHGVYPPFYFPNPDVGSKKYPVSFVGTCMDGREKLIGQMLEQGLPVHVFGTHWERRSDLPRRFSANFHPPVRGESYGQVLRDSLICLGLVSHSNRDEWTMRSYEVPACGSLFLAEKTPTHARMFKHGQEAMLFSSHAECISMAQELLANPLICSRLSKAAYQKTLDQDWRIDLRMAEVIRSLPIPYQPLAPDL